MSLTHLEGGGWTLADLHRLSVHEVDEDTGLVLHAALTGAPGTSSGTTLDPASGTTSELLEAAVASGVLIETEDPTAPAPADADTPTHKETQP